MILVSHGLAQKSALKPFEWVRGDCGPVVTNGLEDRMNLQRAGLPVDTYWYEDEEGMSLFGVERYEPKAFQLFHLVPNGDGGFDYAAGLGNSRPILYRLADIAQEGADTKFVFLCEDEKDADALHRTCRVLATTNYGGPGHWLKEYGEMLRDRHVVILPDNDAEGRAHAARVARELRGTAASAWTLHLPGLAKGGDVSDWLAAGGTREELIQLVKHVAAREVLGEVAPPGPVAVLTRLDEVKPERVSWLWEGWLPRGKLVLLGGHPGDGKSTLTTAMAATLSTGGRWPDGSQAPRGGTIFLLAEDSLGDTVRPRLEQHGADLSRINSLDAIKQVDGSTRSFSLADHLEVLEESIQQHDAALVVIDPLTAFMTSRNRNDDGETRDLLTPLGQLAERCNATVLCVMHVGKPGQSKRTPLQSFMGATAFGAVARQALAVHPISGSDRKLLAVIKSNVATKPPALEWSRPQDSAIVWHGESGYDLETLFSGGGANPSDRSAEAAAFLIAALADGPRLSREISEEASQRGFAEITLRRVRQAANLEARRIGPGRDAPWYIGSAGTDWDALASTLNAEDRSTEPSD